MTMFQTLGRMLPPGGVLRLECDACGRVDRWSRDTAVRRLGADAVPADVRRRLRCRACGGPAQARVGI